eukprot:Ihof_evm2s873 gene=Ihof_evmTU2s873
MKTKTKTTKETELEKVENTSTRKRKHSKKKEEGDEDMTTVKKTSNKQSKIDKGEVEVKKSSSKKASKKISPVKTSPQSTSESEGEPELPKATMEENSSSDEEPELPVSQEVVADKVEQEEEGTEDDEPELPVEKETKKKEENNIAKDEERPEARELVDRLENIMAKAEEMIGGEMREGLPSAIQSLRGLDEEEMQAEYATRLADSQLQILQRVKALLNKLRQVQVAKPLNDLAQDVTLKDIEVDRSLPGNKQYVNMALWQEISRSTNRVMARTDTLLTRLDQEREAGGEVVIGKTVGAQSDKFRDVYMEVVTSAYGEDLEILRK